MKKRLTALLLIGALLGLMLAGCGKSSASDKLGIQGDPKAPKWEGEDTTVTWWLMGGNHGYGEKYWTEMKCFKAIETSVGINIDFQVATSYDAYLPMMAAMNYPDVITGYNFEKYPGRLAAMYEEGVSVDLRDYMDEYMPNFKKLIGEYPDLARDIRLDNGAYTYVSTFYDIHDEEDRIASSIFGLALRKDWLDAVGLEVPTNMEEWYRVLKAFKTQDPNGNGQNDEIPMCMASSGWKYFLPAYGIDDDPSIVVDENGNEKVIFGFMSDAYKEYLQELNKWYTDGLFDNMFAQTSIEKREELVLNNIAGAWKADAKHFDMDLEDSYLSKLVEKAPAAEFVAAPWPKTKDGYLWCFSDIDSIARDTTVITNNAVERGTDKAAAFLIDYMLSEAGSTYLAWGIEGESYEIVDGKKVLKDGMEDKISFEGTDIVKFNLYADPVTISMPSFGQVADYVLAGKTEEYVEACRIWAQGDTSYKMKATCDLSVELQQESDDIEDDMKNYITKQRMRFIQGKEPLTNYDTYVKNVKRLGGDKYVDIWQRAYDSYKTR